MKVILIKQIDNYGRKGEVKNVSEGYAMNYLFPQKLAILANDKTIAQVTNQLIKAKKEKNKNWLNGEKLLKELRGLTLNFSEKADDNGKLFGSVNKEKIISSLAEKNINLSLKNIVLREPIKKIGRQKVAIKIEGNSKVEIVIVVNKL